MTDQLTKRRTYRQGARAQAAEATGLRIVDAFLARLRVGNFDEITLDAVAQDAEVTVQTIIRRFGSKEGLLEAVSARLREEVLLRRGMSVGDVDRTIDTVIADYEGSGDFVMRLLAQEERHAALRSINDVGRAGHRQWLRESFAPWLDPLPEAARRAKLDALVVATDVYVWKLVRRDMGRSTADLKIIISRMVHAALDQPSADPIRKK